MARSQGSGAGRGTSRPDSLRRKQSSSGRRVYLSIVVKLDDLHIRHEGSRFLGELHHQHRANRKVRRNKYGE